MWVFIAVIWAGVSRWGSPPPEADLEVVAGGGYLGFVIGDLLLLGGSLSLPQMKALEVRNRK